MIIRSRAPARISFGGGGTDTSPYCDEHGGCVVSAAITKYAYSTMESRSDPEIHIESGDFLRKMSFSNSDEMSYNNDLDLFKAVVRKMNTRRMGMNLFMKSDVPPKSGLGGSAAAFVSLVGLFDHLSGKDMTNYEIAEQALKLEREELRIAGGKQDQYASVFGGLNFIEFRNGEVRVNPIKMSRDTLLELEKHMVLSYVGDRKIESSGDIIMDQTRKVASGDIGAMEAFHKAKEIAIEMKNALKHGDVSRFGDLLHEGWESKKRFSNMISNRRIDEIYNFARNNGAIGGKITGAGGGGFMLFVAEPNTEHSLRAKLEALGIPSSSVSVDWNGLQTWEVNYIRGRRWF